MFWFPITVPMKVLKKNKNLWLQNKNYSQHTDKNDPKKSEAAAEKKVIANPFIHLLQ